MQPYRERHIPTGISGKSLCFQIPPINENKKE